MLPPFAEVFAYGMVQQAREAKDQIAVNSESCPIHSVETSATNVNDLTTAADLLEGKETVFYANAGYQGIEKREEMQARVSASALLCDYENFEYYQTRRTALQDHRELLAAFQPSVSFSDAVTFPCSPQAFPHL